MEPLPRLDELFLATMLEIARLIGLLDRKGVLSKEEVLAEIKNLQQQRAQRTHKLPDQQELHDLLYVRPFDRTGQGAV
jgi:hypothetical protein